jgi:hypothetical protein
VEIADAIGLRLAWKIRSIRDVCTGASAGITARDTGESESSRSERAGWLGVSPKYYSVKDEHDIEVVERLIGSAFVPAQTAITPAVTILKRMHDDSDLGELRATTARAQAR